MARLKLEFYKVKKYLKKSKFQVDNNKICEKSQKGKKLFPKKSLFFRVILALIDS